ncbi:MAG: type II glyceraldehyde-3-phosphate dehydrogenase [Candidatus Korarchaeota archaeon]|nr:type II glyceraldehyde-3-phosphate dehydrogenase [Candidatus Korarchaeota archaeon]NIU82871.1 type II glyceraldehyde-3-phosphate dehydrogenase [Candidatus Thorarchaeota archaeon]NIW12565.1 type II glyceraldehyde-3-phosphate dehydrogenase [Candidatus Thorarchaeota archaeon]NIW50785.1 type II glyceraldehyde-3-phosphate dehydrogenase [Candidatus Korarchaeota archaeon]
MPPKIFLVGGLGTIGKRVTEAIRKQNDMDILGVGDIKRSRSFVNYTGQQLASEGVDLYALPDKMDLFREAEIDPTGTIQEGIEKADLVVDATPGGIGEKNKPKYEKAGVKTLFQGGESASVAEVAFNSFWNYDDAKGAQFVQVVSCNTTALCRIVYALKEFGVKRVRGVLVRRGGDPRQVNRGPINAIIPKHHIPSHHAEDVKRCIPDLNITTVALKVPTTLMHVHSLNLSLEERVTEGEIIEQMEDTTRIIVATEDIGNTAQIVEWARDMGRKRYDVPEVIVWPGTVKVEGNEAFISYAVHQESIVVPENIDAIRSVLEIEEDRDKSIKKTDNALNIRDKLTF